MATYDEFVKDVLDWSNRTSEVLGYGRIKQCVEFALDDIYRKLRIAPLEKIKTITANKVHETSSYIPVPVDAIEFIQIRLRDKVPDDWLSTKTYSKDDTVAYEGLYYQSLLDNNTNQTPDTANSTYWQQYTPNRRSFRDRGYKIAEGKTDIQTFFGINAALNDSEYYYSREQNKIRIYPDVKQGDTWEVYYYRRLPDADARFNVGTDSSKVEKVESDASIFTTDPDLSGTTLNSGNALIGEEDANGVTLAQNDLVVGTLGGQWLRDENEKAMLFGTLMHVFDFLDEPEMSAKYSSKFEMEITKLNNEDYMRNVKGGTIQTGYYSPLL